MRERTAWWTALRTEDWKPFSETDDESSRRLATVAEESEESSEQGESAQRGGYGAIETPATGPSASMRKPNVLITDDYEPPLPLPSKTYIHRSSEGDFFNKARNKHSPGVCYPFTHVFFLKIVVMDSLFTSP